MKFTFLKRQALLLLSIIIIVGVTSCDSEDPYLEFTDRDSITYAGRAKILDYKSGINKVILNILVNNDPAVNRVVVSWNVKAVEQTAEFTINNTEIGKEKELLLEGIPEGSFNFTVITFTEDGDSSVPSEVLVEVLGDDLLARLNNIEIRTAILNNDNELKVTWGIRGNESYFGKEINYVNTDGENETIFVPANKLENTISNYKIGDEFNFRTVYILDSWIDTLYSESDPLKEIQYNKSAWTAKSIDDDFFNSSFSHVQLIDGNISTFYYSGIDKPLPHIIDIDFSQQRKVNGFTITPRQDALNIVATKTIRYSVSEDNIEWTAIGEVTLEYNRNTQTFSLENTFDNQFLRLEIVENFSDGSSIYASLAEFGTFFTL